jgi:hypothetical protein
LTLFFNTFFSICCESFTYEARKRKVRQAAREKRREIAKYKELTGEDFVFADGDEDEEEVELVVRPIPQIISDTLVWGIPVSFASRYAEICRGVKNSSSRISPG